MIVTASQNSRNNQSESNNMENYSDNDSDIRLPGLHSRGVIDDIENTNMMDLKKDHERIRHDQKIIKMNNQMRELTISSNALAEHITSIKTNS